MADVMECSNCSAPIGRLEDAHVWLDRPICEACDVRIRVKQRRRAGLVPIWLAAATAVAAAVAALALLLGGFAAYRAYAAPPAAEVSRYDWKNGDPPVRMIRKEEGFCYLTALSGGFAGGGEVANVYIADDGYWYLGGQTGTGFLRLSAVSVKRPVGKYAPAAEVP